jgi:hypothetical protein
VRKIESEAELRLRVHPETDPATSLEVTSVRRANPKMQG